METLFSFPVGAARLNSWREKFGLLVQMFGQHDNHAGKNQHSPDSISDACRIYPIGRIPISIINRHCFIHNTRHQTSDGFTSPEAAIVLAAFIVVASVSAYVIIGAGFFDRKARENVYWSVVERVSANLEVAGNVYGTQPEASYGINEIRFFLNLAIGSSVVDLSRMKAIFPTPAATPVILSHGTSADHSTFTNKKRRDNGCHRAEGKRKGGKCLQD